MEILIRKAEGRDIQKGIMFSPEQVKGMEDQKEGLEHRLKMRSAEFTGNGRFFIKPPVNKDDLRKKIKSIDGNLERNAPPKANDLEKNDLWLRAKKIIDIIKVGMPTKQEMHPLRINPVTGEISKDMGVLDSAIKKNMAWESKNKPLIVELKNIARILGYPQLGSIERYRPTGVSAASRMVGGGKELLQGGDNV